MFLSALRPRQFAGYVAVAAGAMSIGALASPCRAQTPENREVRIMRGPGAVTIRLGAPPARAVLGVMLGEGSRADTSGVKLESVAENGPAGKAGLKAGDVISQINGVSLKVAKEDAEDVALVGLAQRRLQRVMSTLNAGDDVTLQVQSGGRSKAVTVKTVSPQSLDTDDERTAERKVERVITRGPDGTVIERRGGGPRAMVGITVGMASNLRDTLGLFVRSVVSGGAAEKAGIIEGERIATVNGIDVRVPREDANDQQVASSRVDRFVREVQKVEPGKHITLRVYGNGRYREVTVTATAGAPQNDDFEFNTDGPRGRMRIDGADIEIDGAQMERAMEQMGRTLLERVRGMELDLRDIPERSGLVRITRSRSAAASP